MILKIFGTAFLCCIATLSAGLSGDFTLGEKVAKFRTARSVPKAQRQRTKSDLKLVPSHISLKSGRSFNLNLPEGYAISIAAEGLKRVRFMARSPDGRIFVTDMYNLTDNRKGVVYILDSFDPVKRSFTKVTPYLTGLRNPNSVAFYTDTDGTDWFYLALTDRLVRYKYTLGENTPTSEPETLATFPDYGLAYKYGGWHLTRTVAVGGNGKLYVSVGSSCNACKEKEEIRASVLEMDPDGKNQRFFVHGLRNAVGLRWIKGGLVATDMGADHLGPERPADMMYSLMENVDYGWPNCYQSGWKIYPDPGLNPGGKSFDCGKVPIAHIAFDAHSAPLGFEYFEPGGGGASSVYYLVALHGSTDKRLGRGYKVVRITGFSSKAAGIEDFITGFIQSGKVWGRPADIFTFDANGFLFTDDNAGVVYYVYKKS